MILLVLNWNHPQAAISTIGSPISTKVGSGIMTQVVSLSKKYANYFHNS